jgi:hypothetical protein
LNHATVGGIHKIAFAKSQLRGWEKKLISHCLPETKKKHGKKHKTRDSVLGFSKICNSGEIQSTSQINSEARKSGIKFYGSENPGRAKQFHHHHLHNHDL